MEKYIRLSVSRDTNGNIFLRGSSPQDAEELRKIYGSCILKNVNTINLDFSNVFDSPKSLRQLRLYKSILPKLVEYISDIEKVYTKEEIEREVKIAFCSHKLINDGVDLFRYYKEKDVDGNIITVREPIPFNKKVGFSLFNEYVQFFKDYIFAKFGIDPFEDLR